MVKKATSIYIKMLGATALAVTGLVVGLVTNNFLLGALGVIACVATYYIFFNELLPAIRAAMEEQSDEE